MSAASELCVTGEPTGKADQPRRQHDDGERHTEREDRKRGGGRDRDVCRSFKRPPSAPLPQRPDIDPRAWLADVLARIADTPQGQLGELHRLFT